MQLPDLLTDTTIEHHWDVQYKNTIKTLAMRGLLINHTIEFQKCQKLTLAFDSFKILAAFQHFNKACL